ncbi:hypothetical protein ACLI08_11250 [Flavobacterium sp. RNTU_13]|uniref:hypothetical protein n=1 Tax=Flavobacterium sp. RNTU_13 TaxID=3375145 RepID=UPI003985CAF5
MGFTVTKVTFPLQGRNNGPDVTQRVFNNKLIPPIINKAYSKVITHHDIMPDPYPRKVKDLLVELTNNVTKEKSIKRFPEPPKEGSDRRIFIELP